MNKTLLFVILFYVIPFSLMIHFGKYVSAFVCFLAAFIIIRYCQNDKTIVKFIDKL